MNLVLVVISDPFLHCVQTTATARWLATRCGLSSRLPEELPRSFDFLTGLWCARSDGFQWPSATLLPPGHVEHFAGVVYSHLRHLIIKFEGGLSGIVQGPHGVWAEVVVLWGPNHIPGYSLAGVLDDSGIGLFVLCDEGVSFLAKAGDHLFTNCGHQGLILVCASGEPSFDVAFHLGHLLR